MSEDTPLLQLKDIKKSFGTIQALDGVTLEVNEGEVLALVGDNGAGKSTLIKCIVGYHQPTSGEISWKGERVKFQNPDEALDQGIAVVYQDMELIPSLTVARNLFLGKEPTTSIGRLDFDRMYDETKDVLDEIGLSSMNDPDLPAENLSGGEAQSIKIGRSLHFDADLLILDEPLRNLSVKESEKVLQTVKRTKEQGIGTIYISHNIFNAYEVADRIHLLDSGQTVDEFPIEEIDSPQELIEKMKKVAGQEATV